MQIRLFTLPIDENEELQNELNRFLRGHKVIDLEKKLVTMENSVLWCFCITYIEGNVINKEAGKNKIDYKNILPEETFRIFSHLRAIRKKIAEEEGLPAYAILTDKEMAEIAKLEDINVNNMIKVHGIGDKKIEKFGHKIVNAFEIFNSNEKGK
jgi:superfamily II DNA helicase RecQ